MGKKKKVEEVRSSPFLECAATIYVPLEDKDRVEQAAVGFSKKLVNPQIVSDDFWEPFLAAAGSFDKMAFVISQEQGWGGTEGRKMLAVAMGVYMDRQPPEDTAVLIQSTSDHRLFRWCAAQLARFSEWKDKEDPTYIGAMEVIKFVESYVKSHDYDEPDGDLDALYPKGASISAQVFIDGMSTERSTAANEGALYESTYYAVEAYGGRNLRELKTGLFTVDPDASSFMMLGAAGPELAYLSWARPSIGADEELPDLFDLASMPYMMWVTRVFAYGHVMDKLLKYVRAGDGQYVTEKGIKKVLDKGYARAREVLKDALLTYPVPRKSLI